MDEKLVESTEGCKSEGVPGNSLLPCGITPYSDRAGDEWKRRGEEGLL
jgi:hypothetical protein